MLSFRYRNRVSGPEQRKALDFFNERVLFSEKNLKCHNWNPGIKNYHYLFNLADLYLTDKYLLVIPYIKSVLGTEKWTPILLYLDEQPENEIKSLHGIIRKQVHRIENNPVDEIKIFFKEKNLISSTVELNFKCVSKNFVQEVIKRKNKSVS